jgi:hypothetical protein
MKIVFTISLLLCFTILVAQDGWTLRKDQSGIQIYTQQSEGSKLQKFKAVTVFDCHYDKILKVLRDYDNFEDWMYSIEEAEVFVNEPDHDVIYQETDLPWPCDNRDVVMERKFIKTANGLRIDLKTNDGTEYKPYKKGVERMKEAKGSWEFKTVGGKTEIVYQFLGDPGGQIPTWVVNLFIVEGPYKTMLNIREKAGCIAD